jgi:hypothetical protein
VPTAPAAPLPPPFPNGSSTALPPGPNERAKDGSTPCIRLAGQDWPIPLLAPRQNRIVVPAVSKITKRMREIAERKLGRLDAEDKASLLAQLGSDAELRKKIWQITDFSFEIASELEPAFFDHIADALYWALTRAHPQLTRPQFDDMAIGMLEMIDAIGTVAQQTGMMKRADPSAGPLAAAAPASPSSPTGTPSSPMSATG